MFEFIDVKYKEFIDISTLRIEDHKITTLVGASGSGKTTILKMLNKMVSPTDGSILYNGEDLRHINSVELRRKVTMLTQNTAMFSGTIRDNLLVGLRFQGKEDVSDDELYNTIEKVRLRKKLNDPIDNLSGGEKQRIALARVLLLNPEVYLFDEPSSALDEETETAIIQMLTKHVDDNKKTMIMVTHSRKVSEKYSNTIIEISNGKVLKKV